MRSCPCIYDLGLPRLFGYGLASAQNIASLCLPAEGPDKTEAGKYVVEAGTKVPLSLINTISTKHSIPGDRVYLETAFPILSGGRIVIPVGSYVAGTVTQLKKPGRVKGRGELYVRFDTLTLPNGVTRDFRKAGSAAWTGRAMANWIVVRARSKAKGIRPATRRRWQRRPEWAHLLAASRGAQRDMPEWV